MVSLQRDNLDKVTEILKLYKRLRLHSVFRSICGSCTIDAIVSVLCE